MKPDIGFWFGVTFDEYLGKYIVDITGELFDMGPYSLRAKVSETKQVTSTITIQYHLVPIQFANLQVKYEGSWWSMDNYFKTDHDREYDENHYFNNIIACFKMEEGYCIKDGVVNYFNPSCYQNLKRFSYFHLVILK